MITTQSMTKSEIFRAYNKMRGTLKGDPKAQQRLNKALGILQSKNGRLPDVLAEYRPSASFCGCKDWEFRFARKRAYTGICKHMMVVTMLEMIEFDRKAHNVTEQLSVRFVNA